MLHQINISMGHHLMKALSLTPVAVWTWTQLPDVMSGKGSPLMKAPSPLWLYGHGLLEEQLPDVGCGGPLGGALLAGLEHLPLNRVVLVQRDIFVVRLARNATVFADRAQLARFTLDSNTLAGHTPSHAPLLQATPILRTGLYIDADMFWCLLLRLLPPSGEFRLPSLGLPWGVGVAFFAPVEALAERGTRARLAQDLILRE